MEVNFEKKFEKILKEESKGFGIDWSLVEIEHVLYQSTLMNALPMKLDKYTVRMRVVGVEGEIPDIDVDNWFRSHKFIYGMMSKGVRTELEKTDVLTFDVGTIESIVMQIRHAFRRFDRS